MTYCSTPRHHVDRGGHLSALWPVCPTGRRTWHDRALLPLALRCCNAFITWHKWPRFPDGYRMPRPSHLEPQHTQEARL